MWASLTLPRLQYSVGFLGRFQQDPDNRAENCLRAVVRWVMGLPEYMREFYPTSGTSEKILSGFVDASWNVTSVSGTILCWKGMMLKCFSKKQATTALSSAEAELVALVEAAKEAVYVGLLMESLLQGLQPQQETGSYRLVFYSDSEAAVSISAMSGLLRRVRHLELRARFLQELVNSGRLKPEFIAGAENPADGLTKATDTESMLRNLLQGCNLVVIELFCSKDSAIACTPGGSWRFYNWKRPAFRRKWRLKLQEHQRCWKLIGSLLGPYAKEPALLVTQEWPKTSSLWKEEVYLKVKKTPWL